MSLVIVLGALLLLIVIACRGYSVILFAPVAAMGAVLLTDPQLVAPVFTGLFMEKTAGFVRLYLPVFLLGAVFGKVIEISGFSKSIVSAVIRLAGTGRVIIATVVVCGIMTYGGVSLFVVVFAVYPLAAEMFRQANIPKRLIPATIALGSFTFTMDALPGSPQIQNIIPTTFFKTTIYAAPWLGLAGAVFILGAGLAYIEWRCRQARLAEEGYGENLINEPATFEHEALPHPAVAILPLLLVGGVNKFLTVVIPGFYGESTSFVPAVVGNAEPVVQKVSQVAALWAVQGALLVGILSVLLFAWKPVVARFAEGSRAAVQGALLASLNTASEYGFGAVIASLPGFLAIAETLRRIPDPLLNEAITTTALAGITGSASGGLGIALAAMSESFIASAEEAGIPLEVCHRIAAMASGGMDTLPHNGAVITLLAVTGLTHRQAYGDIFVLTLIKTCAVFAVIALYRATGIV